MGTLGGFPNPPAMSSGERSSPALDAIVIAVPLDAVVIAVPLDAVVIGGPLDAVVIAHPRTRL